MTEIEMSYFFLLKVAKKDEAAASNPKIMPAKLFVPKAPM